METRLKVSGGNGPLKTEIGAPIWQSRYQKISIFLQKLFHLGAKPPLECIMKS